jgi:aminoglycoside phosphotransferase (APT) family kinase protein
VPEELLHGGFVTEVVRVGDTVRRRPGRNAEFVHRLLEWLERAGWDGAPRFTGVDEQRREVLSFLPGHVPLQPAEQRCVRSDDSLAAAAELVRQFHDLTAGTSLADGCEVVCHNDLSPGNTVYRERAGVLQPVAFIDWDIAGPGKRIHDVAHVCWQYAGLGPQIEDTARACCQVRIICDAYGLADRAAVVDTILWWQSRCWRGIQAGAAAGEPAMMRLHDSGATQEVRQQHAWVAMHRAELQAALR